MDSESRQGIAIFIPNEVDFKPKVVRRDKEGHIILIKGMICQEEITIVNICVPNVGVTQLH
jgi:hypothetical protein